MVNRFLRVLTASALALASVTASAATDAETFPNRPITIVYPGPPGGLADTLLRQLGKSLESTLGQPIVMDYRPGAASLIATQFAARAKPDGHTLLMVTSSFLINSLMLRDAKYDALKDFTPVVALAETSTMLVVNQNVPAKDYPEFLSYYSKNKGKLTVATGGTGFSNDIVASMLEDQLKLGLTRVPYKGESQQITDLLGGQVDAAFITPGTFKSYADRLRPIAVGGSARLPQLPQVPTFLELGVRGPDLAGYVGLVTMTGTDPAIVQKLYDAMQKFLRDPELVARWESQYLLKAVAMSPRDFGDVMAEHIPRWRRALQNYPR